MENALDKIYEYLATYGLSIIAAALIFVIGRWVARIVSNLVGKAMNKTKSEKTLVSFVQNITYISLLVFVVIAALSRLGIQTASFIAVVGAAGLAIGLALQGTLANFASGVLMLIFKPIKIGDFVEIAGAKGTVQKIQIFNTIINTVDNIRVIIPNSHITSNNISNYTANDTRRVDLTVGISYEDNLQRAQEIIKNILANDPKILKSPAATVAVSELGESSVNIVVRPWVKPCDYWDVFFDITAKIKINLERNGITIPYPQRDVHMITSNKHAVGV